MVTRPMPGNWEIFCASRVSAKSSTFDSGIGLGSQRQRQDRGVRRIGFAVNRRSGQVGRQISLRGVDRRLHFLFGHIDIQGSANCIVMTELPPELVEVIWLSPGTWPNWRSSGAVTAEATTSGLAPG